MVCRALVPARFVRRGPFDRRNALSVRADLGDEIIRTLRTAFLEMTENPDGLKVLAQFGAVSFLPTTEADYAPVFDMANKAGIDNLSNYDYENR